MQLNSKKYPGITYEKGEEIFLSPDEADPSFFIDIEEKLTANDAAMTVVAAALDEVEALEQTAKDFLKTTLSNKKSKYYKTVAFFMEFHRDDIDADTVAELFPVEDPSTLSFIDMVDYLKIIRFGNFIEKKSKKQAFVLDLSFDPEITDELMVIYFSLEKKIYHMAHES